MMATTDGDTFTVPEVAARLRLSEYTVREYLRTGRLRGFRPGGTKAGWRVRMADLERFIVEASNRPEDV